MLIGGDLVLHCHTIECMLENQTNSRKTSESDKESEHVALLVSSKVTNWPLQQKKNHKIVPHIEFAFRGHSYKESITIHFKLSSVVRADVLHCRYP